MPCRPEELKHVPLFALLDDDEAAILAAQVEVKHFAARQRIYKIGDPGKNAYVVMAGKIQVTTVDEDHQEVVLDEHRHLSAAQRDRSTRCLRPYETSPFEPLLEQAEPIAVTPQQLHHIAATTAKDEDVA